MFNRRMLVAFAACAILSASTAMAGGGGTKKDSTIKVVNSTNNAAYVFVDVPDADIQRAAGAADPLAEFKKLGGKQVAGGGGSADFKVLAGGHTVTAVDIVAQALLGQQNVTTTKGQTATVTF